MEHKIVIGADGDEPVNLEAESVLDGTKVWEDFSSFVFDETGIVVLFHPNKVAAYVFGPQSTNIEYSTIILFMQPVYVSALGIEHIAWKSKDVQSRS